MIIIPTFQNKSSKFRQDIILNTISVTLTFQWNARAGYWFVSITDGTYELLSKKLVANWPLLRRSRASFPTLTGDIIVLKTDQEAEGELTYDNLNNGWTLYYLDKFELVQWEISNGV